MTIRRLSSVLINQIAAGEVIERPASVIKELVENSIDAGAKNVEISVVEGGKSYISVKDDGCGISHDDLPLAIERHATSKLQEDNLFSIGTLGFRGEALASISSIARVVITSKFANADSAYKMSCEGGGLDISPASLSHGTLMEIKDLFYSTPARLKFLKTTNTESDACYSNFINLALCSNEIAYKYVENKKERLVLKQSTLKDRVADVFGEEFIKNTQYIEANDEGISLKCFLGVPTYNKSTSSSQKIFVNGRCIKDRQILSIIRHAYRDVMPHDRYPVYLIYIEMPADMVDVNVHPAKTEVRFKDMYHIRRVITSAVRDSLLSDLGRQPASALSRVGLDRFFPKTAGSYNNQRNRETILSENIYSSNKAKPKAFNENIFNLEINTLKAERTFENNIAVESQNEGVFGSAVAQIDNTYIISVTADSVIIIDQHAVSERILLERINKKGQLESQQILSPEVMVLDTSQVEALDDNKNLLEKLGFTIEKMAKDTVLVRGVPAIISDYETKTMVADIAAELQEIGTAVTIEKIVHSIFSTMACHNSLRAGKSLSIAKMNHLLREMEASENIAQCCHGRPSYVILSAHELRKMFERV